MTIAELQKFLKSMAEVLAVSGAKSVAGEIEYVVGKLEPFSQSRLKEFADFLEKASRPEAPKPPPKVRADPQQLQTAFQTIQGLYDQALSPEMTVEAIESGVRQFGSFTKEQLTQLAKLFGISRSLATKEAVLKAIIQKIVDRKGAFERATV